MDPDLMLMISVMTSVQIHRTHLSTKKMLEQGEHGVVISVTTYT
jgi:hypothetical protein